MKPSFGVFLAIGLVATACGSRPVEVDDPFYLWSFQEQPDQVQLFRCPDGPQGTCAGDGLPGPRVIAAGADDRFVVVAQVPVSAPETTRYFYFARVPEERAGWGNNPERIVGPLTSEQFEEAKSALGLPELTVRP